MYVDVSFRENAGYAFLVGVAWLLVSDVVWFHLMGEMAYGDYLEWLRACGIVPNRALYAGAIFTHAVVASFTTSPIHTHTAGEAYGVGAWLGVWVFAAYNITTFAATRTKYPLKSVGWDMLYGTTTSGLLCLFQHLAKQL
jgi:uncharacterized membrane protein